MAHQFVLIIDFGGQYNQLIARRVRECGVYCEVHSYKKMTIEELKSSIQLELSSLVDQTVFTSMIPQI